MIEEQVAEELLPAELEPDLAADERKALSHFEQEALTWSIRPCSRSRSRRVSAVLKKSKKVRVARRVLRQVGVLGRQRRREVRDRVPGALVEAGFDRRARMSLLHPFSGAPALLLLPLQDLPSNRPVRQQHLRVGSLDCLSVAVHDVGAYRVEQLWVPVGQGAFRRPVPGINLGFSHSNHRLDLSPGVPHARSNHTIYRLGSVRVPVPRHEGVGPGLTEATLKEREPVLGRRWWK